MATIGRLHFILLSVATCSQYKHIYNLLTTLTVVRLRGAKKVQNLGKLCYEESTETHDTKGDFGLGSP
jgi:hypothetical protein